MRKAISYFFVTLNLSVLVGVLFSINSLYAADRYWVDGTGLWSDSTNHWSATSGGFPGATLPSDTDNVFFDNNSFTALSQLVFITAPAFCRDMDWTGSSDSIPDLVGAATLNIYGSLIFVTGMTNSFTGTINFRATTLGNTITTAGQMFLGDVYFDGVSGEWILQDNFQVDGVDIYLENGILNTNDQNITCRSFFSSNANARELNLNSSTITLEASWDLSIITNLVFDAGTSTILFNDPLAVTNFYGGGLTYYDLTASEIGFITIYGSNTFNTLSIIPNIFFGTDLILEKTQTQTVADLDVVGISNLLRINIKSTEPGVVSTIFKANGVVCTDWLNIQDNFATGGATFYAGDNSNNLGNVGGWELPFTDCPDTLTTTIAGTNITCNGLCDGTATVTAIDGVPPYTYLWSNGDTGLTADSLCADTFYVIVYDAVPDTAYDTIIIIEPLLLTANISDSTNALCKDECNGDAIAAGSGGTLPYTYSWTNGDTGPTADSLCADTLYTVTVIDFNGCDTTTSVVLSEPDSLLSSIDSITNVSCSGLCDGSATVTHVGGTPPYTYLWDDDSLQTTPTATGLCAGTYSVIVRDSNNCTTVSSVTITEPASPLVIDSITGTDASCGGLCDGTSTVFLSGGTLPYTYLWTNGDTDSIADSLCGSIAGIIDTVTITDANGCSATANDTIFAPLTLTSSITDSTNLSCSDTCDGTATITPVGGVPLYTFLWTPSGQTTQTAILLCDIIYTGTVTDSNGCQSSSNVLLEAPDTLTATIVNSTNANCFGTCSGSATVRAEGGTSPYTFLWLPSGGTDSTATGLCAGFYTVTVTDAKGCDTTDTITIIEPTVITNTTSVSCAGACDGTATVTPVGGTPPYSYQWDSAGVPLPGETDSILDSLCIGTYCVVTTDFNGCSDTTCITIDLPTITLSATDPSCSGDCDGTATVIAAGGFPPYTYVWTDAIGSTISTDTIADTLCAGWYYIELTDSAGCVLTDSVQIIDPLVLTSGTMDSTDVLCFGDSNGTATVTPVGGTPPYAYLWNDPLAQTDSIADSLSVGTYTVTVTDSNGCTAIDSIAVSGPSLLTAAITSSSDPTCGGVCDGDATVTPGGGTGAYTYSWSPTAPVQTTPSATGLCAVIAGTTYTVVVADANGCTATDSVTLSEPPPLVLTMTIDSNASCNGLCDGGATVAPTGGTGAYTYEWDTSGVLLPGETNPTITGLCAGVYYRVRVNDANGCITIDSVLISEPPLLTAAILSSTNDSCGGPPCNGTATVTPGGGTPTYDYLWSPSAGGQTTALAINLCAGTHYVTVTDANGCTAADTVIITEPPVLTSGITGTNISCYGDCDGVATVTPSGGSPPYTYQWDLAGVPLPGETDSIIDTLCTGTYNVLVTDTNLCTTTAGITITQPAAALTSNIPPASGTCGGVCDVQAIVTPSDGTPGYIYQWYDSSFVVIPGETDSILDSLCEGKIYAIVTDTNGCTVTDSVTVTMPATLVLDTLSTTNDSCAGTCVGTATVSATGGTGIYTFSWSNNDTGPTAASLCATPYTAKVTDANGCVDSLQIIITGPGGLSALISGFTNDSCNGACSGDATVSVIGGMSPYTYQWYDASFLPISGETDSLADSLCAGTYYAIVTDNNGCIVTSDTVTVTEPPVLTSFISDSTDVSCNGVCDGSATITPSGGAPPFSYLWTPGGQTDSTATGLCAGLQIATVTDTNGCMAIDSVIINQPAALGIVFVVTGISCNGECDGGAMVIAAGGILPYTYIWTDSIGDTISTDTNVTALCPGWYYIELTDSTGCVLTDSVIISDPVVLTADTTSTVNAGCTSCDGAATVVGSGGLPPYTYLWSNLDTGTFADSLCASIHTVTVTDSNGCDTTISVTILGAGGLTTSISTVPISCIGVCDGEATVIPSGGVPPYTHQWDSAGVPLSGETDSIITGLCAGTTYTDTVTDANGCITIAPVTLIPPAVFLSSITDSSDVTCNGDSDGTITVTPTGGTPPYTYEWLDNTFTPIGQTDSTATGLGPGCYNVTIDDANGCNTTQTNICITAPPPFSATITDSTNVSCNGLCDGSATVATSGGILPLTYSWSPSGDTIPIADSLCAGMHIVTVTDSSGCVRTDSVLITEPAVFAIDTIIPVNVSCKDTCDGQATVVIIGGSGGFSYLWDDPDFQTTQTATGLCDGIYSVTVTDTNGCGTDSSSVIIAEPVELTSSVTKTDATCGGLCDGTATVTAFGGTGAYTYSWSPSGGIDTTETGICEGIDTVTVTDANGCIAMSFATINAPDTLKVDTFSVTPSQCLPICDGQATIVVTGGISPYNYSWNTFPVQTDSTADSLCISTYTVTVTDDSGCVATLDVIIFGPGGFFSTIDTVIDATCFGDCDGEAVVFAGGGFPPYTYSWDTLSGGTIPGATDSNITSLCAGDYEAVVTDNTGCISTAPVTINEPAAFLANITDSTGVSCFGDSNGTATVSVSGGVPPYTYAWSNGDTDSIADSLYAGIHSVIVTDTNGCGTDTLYVTIIGPLALTAVITDSMGVSCFNDSNGTATVFAAGGTTPYTYLWSNNDITDTADSLYPGIHSVIVTDSNGCTTTVNVTIIEPAPLTSGITDSTDTGCGTICNGTATVSVSGGTPPYNYLWGNPAAQTDSFADSLCLGINEVTITDTNGCITTDSVMISAPPVLVASNIVTFATCNTINDGAIVLTVTDGTPPYTYLWSPGGDTTQNLTYVFPDTFIVIITDSIGCSITDTAIVSVLITVIADAGLDISICAGDTAILTATAIGSNLLWSPGGTLNNDTILNPLATPDTTTIYILTVNTGACTDWDTVVVNIVIVNAGEDITIVNGSADTLAASGGTNYLWTPSAGLSDTTIPNPIASPFQTTTYYVIDENGCVDSVIVIVQEGFPDGITPNGDGFNDEWELDFLRDYPDVSVQVYNRWGERVFNSPEGEKYANKFDGTFEGKELPVGTYYYIIDFNDSSEPMTGPITIMR